MKENNDCYKQWNKYSVNWQAKYKLIDTDTQIIIAYAPTKRKLKNVKNLFPGKNMKILLNSEV